MAPILVEKKYIFLSVVSLILVLFFGLFFGYSLGFNQATIMNQISSSVTRLNIPQDTEEKVTERKPILVSVPKEPGEFVDVDTPDEPKPENDEAGSATGKVAIAEPEPANDMVASESNMSEESSSDTSEVATQTTVVTEADEAKLSEQLERTLDNPIPDTADADTAKYTIQVALYGSKKNAERHVQQLKEQNLSGFYTVSEKEDGKVLYNVRFGHHIDRKSVQEALDVFKNKMSGSGYVITIGRRAEN